MNTTNGSANAEFSYRNDLGDVITFTPADDEAVVAFDADDTADIADALDSADTLSVRVANADGGFAIVRTPAGDDADDLLDSAPVDDSMPVLIDGDGNRRYVVPGRFEVQFDESIDDERARDVLEAEGLTVLVDQRTPGYFTVSLPKRADLFETVQRFNDRSDVAFAEPAEIGLDSMLTIVDGDPETGQNDAWDPLLTDDEPVDRSVPVPDVGTDIDVVPSYGDFSKLWGLRNIGQTVDRVRGRVDADIDGTMAWDITQGDRDVVVAVIDTGADLDHPDLRSQLLPRGSEDWDFAASDGSPDDHGSHGTHVAGTAVGNQNGSGVSGVAPRSRLMPLRVNLTTGMNANRADAINYVAARARRERNRRFVVNCSWRMNGDHAGVRHAIRNAARANVVIVFAAGNDNRDTDRRPQYPGVYPEVIAVAATDQRDERAWFSNYGDNVDVSAPGVNIWSSVPDDRHGFKDGTSMAAPHVAGLAALIWSRNSSLSAREVRHIIESTTDDIDARNPGFESKLGTGRINAYRALVRTPAPRFTAMRVRTLPFPQANRGSSTALTFIPGFPIRWFGRRPQLVFLTQQAGSERMYFLRPSDGRVLRSIDPQANDTIGSMAYDGRVIHVSNVTVGAGTINEIDPATGRQTGSIPAPSGRGEGLAHLSGSLYASTISHIHRIRPSDGRVLWSRPAPGGECRGLAAGDGVLFAAHGSSGRISVINPNVPGVLHGTIELGDAGRNRAEGLAYDSFRNELYVADQGRQRIDVYRITF